MNCHEGMEMMQRYVDRDLNEEENSRLLKHVGQCPDCASMFQRLVRLSRGLEQLPHVAPPFSLVDAILPELDKIQPETSSGLASAQSEKVESAGRIPKSRRSAQRNFRSWIPRISGVAAAGIVALLLLLNRPDAEPPGNQQAASMPGATASQESAASAGSLGGDMSSADVQLFAAPTVDANPSAAPKAGYDSIANTERSAGGGMQGFEGSQRNKDLPLAGESHSPVMTEGIRNFEKQANPSGADAHLPAEDGPPVEGLPAERPLVGEPLVDGSSNEGFAGEGLIEEERFEGEPSISIMDFMPETEEAVSPDGQWRAVIIDGALQLYRMSDDSLVYDPAPDQYTRSGLQWSEDSSVLQYIGTDPDGNEIQMELRIQDSAFVETKR